MLKSLFNKVAGLEELLHYAIRLYNLVEIFLIIHKGITSLFVLLLVISLCIR